MNKENSCNRMLSRFILIVCCILSACHSNEKRDILSLYQQSDSLSLSKNSFVEDDSLAVADWVVCDGENLIVYDVHLGYAFTLFDQVSGNYIGPWNLPAHNSLLLPYSFFPGIYPGISRLQSVSSRNRKVLLSYPILLYLFS